MPVVASCSRLSSRIRRQASASRQLDLPAPLFRCRRLSRVSAVRRVRVSSQGAMSSPGVAPALASGQLGAGLLFANALIGTRLSDGPSFTPLRGVAAAAPESQQQDASPPQQPTQPVRDERVSQPCGSPVGGGAVPTAMDCDAGPPAQPPLQAAEAGPVSTEPDAPPAEVKTAAAQPERAAPASAATAAPAARVASAPATLAAEAAPPPAQQKRPAAAKPAAGGATRPGKLARSGSEHGPAAAPGRAAGAAASGPNSGPLGRCVLHVICGSERKKVVEMMKAGARGKGAAIADAPSAAVTHVVCPSRHPWTQGALRPSVPCLRPLLLHQ